MHKTSSIATFDAKAIDKIFAPIDQANLPGAAVAIAIGGVPVYRKGFGLASIELPVVLAPTMRMRIGSTTKHFTALAYMLLCEEGRAHLDDEIGLYLPELNRAARHVTVHQLMSHTSGIRDVFAITSFFHGMGRPVTDTEMLAYYKDIEDVDFAPGTRWDYNNGGYVLLTAAIERITGQPLEDVLRERIFEPVGMTDTMLRRWDADFVPNSATLHMIDQRGRYSRDYIGMENSGAGGLVSSMDDMLRWLKHMDAPTVGSAETWTMMKSPHHLSSGASTGYGLGLIISTYRGLETVAHGGGVLGGNSQMIKARAVELDISIAVNRADLSAADLANQIIDACVDGLEPGSDHGGEEQISGVFVSKRSGRVVELFVKEDQQQMSVDGSAGVPVSRDRHGALQLPPTLSSLQQAVVAHGSAIELIEFGDTDVLDRAEFSDPAKLSCPVGIYEAAPIAVQATITADAAGPRLTTSGRHGGAKYRLEALTGGVWKAIALNMPGVNAFLLTVDPDGNGFAVTAPRMSKMRFGRVQG